MKLKNLTNNWRTSLLTALCAATALAFAVAPQQASAKKGKKIGIQLYSVMSAVQNDPSAAIERLAGMGYNNVELVQWGGDTKVFGMEPAEFKALCDRNGVEIVSTHSSIQEDPANVQEIEKRWRQLFETQKACGGKYFVIPSYNAEYTEAGIKQMADYFNRIGKIASEYGLMLGYHNHSGEYQKLKGSDKVMWEYLVENTDPRYVCFELDVYWCEKGGKDPVEYLKKYPSRIHMLHVKDYFVIGQSGKVDFEGIFKQFYKNGMSEYVVEIETPGWLRNIKNADGSKLTQEQINERLFEAAERSACYLANAPFVK